MAKLSRFIFIFFNILEAVALSLYISTIKRYKLVFKEKADPITIGVIILIAVAMFIYIIVCLPTELLLLYGDINNTNKFNTDFIGVIREFSVYIMVLLLDCSAFLNLTRWISILDNIGGTTFLSKRQTQFKLGIIIILIIEGILLFFQIHNDYFDETNHIQVLRQISEIYCDCFVSLLIPALYLIVYIHVKKHYYA